MLLTEILIMTTFSNLPEEVSSMIFERLSTPDLLASQRVCHAWYTLAHCALLRVVHLPTVKSMEKFIASMDSNLCPKYLQAVKEINVFSWRGFPYCKDHIYKLMFRFPNLKKVKITGLGDLLAQFTEEICIDLLKTCPKLNHFETYYGNYNLLYKVRLLLTVLRLDFLLFSHSQDQTTLQYLSNFPRLQKIESYRDYFNSFQEVLELLQQLPNLKDLTSYIKDVQDNSVERHLANTAKNERDILIDRLSNITRFYVNCPLNVCVNSMRIFKYLTGLKSFMMDINCGGKDGTEQENLVFVDILDLLCKYTGEVGLYKMQLSDCEKILPIIQDRVLTSGGIFRLCIYDPDLETQISCFLRIRSTQQKKQLTMEIPGNLMLDKLTPEIPTLNNINEVQIALVGDKMKFFEKSQTYKCEQELLDKFPMVRKVILDIPKSYRDRSYDNKTYPLVEELRLQIYQNCELECKELLSRFTTMFPNLKHLDLYDLGIWKKKSKEFHVDLSNYSLQRLTMDLLPVRYKISDEQDFHVVELTLTTSRQKHLYKIKLKTLSFTRINESDLQGHTDYVRVKINVDSLQKLEVYYVTWTGGVCSLDLSSMQRTQDVLGSGCLKGPIPHLTLFNESE